MKIRKYKSLNCGMDLDDCEIICTPEERDALKYALELVGVNVMTSMFSKNECHVYVRNEYKDCMYWSSDAKLNKRMANEFFERNKRF